MQATMRRGARRWALTAGIGVVAVGALSFSAFGYFSTTINDSTQADSGTMTMKLGAANSADNRMSISADNIAPGDTIQRALTLTLDGSVATKNVHFKTEATTSSLLDTDTVNGLQMKIERCSVPWTVNRVPGTTYVAQDAGYDYSCGGTTTTPWAETPVVQGDQFLTKAALNIPNTAGNSPNYFRITLRFPTSAGDEFQDGSTCNTPPTWYATCSVPNDNTSMKSIIRFTFYGDQRDPVQK